MKQWLRENPDALPPDMRGVETHSRRLRAALESVGWTAHEEGTQIHLYPPGAQLAIREQADESDADAPRQRGERAWVHSLIRPLEVALAERDPSLRVLEGRRLAYRREVLRYRGDVASSESGMRYETDMLIAEGNESGWLPRVVVEAKLRKVSTHTVITYSQKAANHKNVHPYLRYGIFLGARGNLALPGRLYRHGAEFDFMVSWKGLEPNMAELDGLVDLITSEVEASRLLQHLMFETRRRNRSRYTLFHRQIAARIVDQT
jgi:hypothetical protein